MLVNTITYTEQSEKRKGERCVLRQQTAACSGNLKVNYQYLYVIRFLIQRLAECITATLSGSSLFGCMIQRLAEYITATLFDFSLFGYMIQRQQRQSPANWKLNIIAKMIQRLAESTSDKIEKKLR